MIGIAVIAFFLCAINIFLWIALFKKFKELFSTDDIINSTRDEMNRMIEDVNRNTARDIRLIDSRIKELKATVADADRHIVVAKNELKKQANSAVYQQRISELSSNAKKRKTEVVRAAESYQKNSSSNVSAQTVPEMREENGNRNFQSQDDLSNRQNKNQNRQTGKTSQNHVEIVNSSGTRFSVENDEMPDNFVSSLGPEVQFTEIPVQPKKDLAVSVLELYDKGESVESIANSLNCSTTEVQFVIDMES